METSTNQMTDCPCPSVNLAKKPESTDKFSGVFNVGNPVFTCAIDVPVEMPSPVVPEECLPGYSCQPVNIMYRTTSSEYGSLPPTCYSVPSTYHPMSQQFSEVLGKCGMPRNHSLNCAADKSRVPHH